MTLTRRLLLVLGILAVTGMSAFILARARPDRESSENYSLIEEGLYMGGLVSKPPPGTTAVLNLCGREDPYQCKMHVWSAIEDAAPAPSIEWLQRQVEFVDARRKAGDTVYVHCHAGISRSGMVVIAYEMYKNRWTRDEALKFVRSKRPVTRPNPAFWDRLREWEYVVFHEIKKGR
jgi:Dual specificity phosphatase, catalytic domain